MNTPGAEPLFRVVAIRERDWKRVVMGENVTRLRADRLAAFTQPEGWDIVVEPIIAGTHSGSVGPSGAGSPPEPSGSAL